LHGHRWKNSKMLSNTAQYHHQELKIAQDPSHPSHLLPPSAPPGARVLDIGCGAGQTLIAAYPGRLTFGIDVDLDALLVGRQWTSDVAFTCGSAETLPFKNAEFDCVVARVSLVYTDIPRSLREIRRVLKSGGRVWMTLHPISLCWAQARNAGWKGRLYFFYIVSNGLCFHFFQKQFRLFGKQESFQTEGAIRRALVRAGFREIVIDRRRGFVVDAKC
jgi:ubiquinone/menaquinone biosynthesis C-methylase UbiE